MSDKDDCVKKFESESYEAFAEAYHSLADSLDLTPEQKEAFKEYNIALALLIARTTKPCIDAHLEQQRRIWENKREIADFLLQIDERHKREDM